MDYIGYNPYESMCPLCGEIICLKCAEIEGKLGGLCECDECAPRIRRLEKAQATHISKHHDPNPIVIERSLGETASEMLMRLEPEFMDTAARAGWRLAVKILREQWDMEPESSEAQSG